MKNQFKMEKIPNKSRPSNKAKILGSKIKTLKKMNWKKNICHSY
jgi:hypothetical protein